MDVALPAVFFLCIDVLFYWVFMYCYEIKIWRKFTHRRPTEATSNASFINQNAIDEDIIEEERRVNQADPHGLTVKVNQI